ncbi:tyrosine-protein kinase Btk29A isoform X2 [Orussus abietinus]|nr:tyrosine-protein kinase Btk29A isoform X2 [Orussus abietinus]XP_023287552.1 tyrosine-protein kinase Btk29A isoform X2 [Orussus abietinus]XP_023287553.1 tyrosine-protein kinase Btk29A isoform X2 [Orussus abietinus]XP_023287554.1 tyrosine-protein kinase Btk29A isoform X2 [Orussus abietinus]
MAGKDGKVEPGGVDVVRQGFMVKRSQNKKRFTPINYKQRWFVLTRRHLVYYDGDGERRKERGRIAIESVHVVETATLGARAGGGGGDVAGGEAGTGGGGGIPPGLPFQVGYREAGQEYTLYLLAPREQDRAEWIRAIRAVCSENPGLSGRYHAGLWSGKRWSCCRLSTRSAEGCDTCSSWASKPANSSNSACSVPAVAAAATAAATATATAAERPLPAPAEANNNPVVQPQARSTIGTPSTPIMPGGAPGTPSSKAKDKLMMRTKVVVALYPFRAIEGGDLSLEKGAEYEVLDDSQEHWWKVKDEHGSIGYIPSNYVKEKELLGLQKYEWYVGDMSRQRAESLLKQEDKEGCFVVRNSSTKGLYTLSLYTKVPHPHVKHYHIKQNTRGEFYLSEKHCCGSIPDLVNYHRHNSGGLASRLKTSPCDRPVPPTAGLSHDKWEIDPAELHLLEELGSGQFGVVRRGKWRGSIDVAVKMMKEGTMSEDDFIEEAKVMTKLQHQNLVQLYGVCSKDRPIYIVTEYMRHGSLLNYLRRHEATLGANVGLLLDMCIQVCKGMAYLERHNYIHRDLAARNCLVGSENVVKVADFGLARYVLDDQYTSSGGTKFPIKWAPPEVLNYTRFSSKSDVWAYGVLMWEVFTCGRMPYGRLKNTEVVERVQRGIILEKPKACFKEVYEVMRKCWAHCPEVRPSFRVLKEQLINVSQGLLND